MLVSGMGIPETDTRRRRCRERLSVAHGPPGAVEGDSFFETDLEDLRDQGDERRAATRLRGMAELRVICGRLIGLLASSRRPGSLRDLNRG